MAVHFNNAVVSPANWSWFVKAKSKAGKKASAESPDDKVVQRLRFVPSYSGIFRVTVPIRLKGFSALSAKALSGNLRRAGFSITVDAHTSHRSNRRQAKSKVLIKREIRKEQSKVPIDISDELAFDIDAWVGTKPKETMDAGVTATVRGILKAWAHHRHSQAELNLNQVKFGPAKIRMIKAKPRPGEQKAPGVPR